LTRSSPRPAAAAASRRSSLARETTFLRIATSLKNDKGERATGTALGKDHPAYASLIAGQDYTGKATLFGRQFMARYRPLKDAQGRIVGALFVGMNIMASLDQLKNTIRQIKLGDTGYVYVLDGRAGETAGTLVIHPAQEGKNIAAATDSDGRRFIQEILDKRNGEIVYPWINKEAGETSPRNKIVVFSEFADWQWIIGAGTYTDELFSLADKVRKLMIGATLVLSLVLSAILLLLINRLVVGPLRAAADAAQRLSEGDLLVHIEARGSNEVSQLMTAMQAMVGKLREIIGEVRVAADNLSATPRARFRRPPSRCRSRRANRRRRSRKRTPAWRKWARRSCRTPRTPASPTASPARPRGKPRKAARRWQVRSRR
jgi:methyl-accepting chemotaxis protein